MQWGGSKWVREANLVSLHFTAWISLLRLRRSEVHFFFFFFLTSEVLGLSQKSSGLGAVEGSRVKSVCHSWPPPLERVWEGFLLLPRGNLTALLGVDGSCCCCSWWSSCQLPREAGCVWRCLWAPEAKDWEKPGFSFWCTSLTPPHSAPFPGYLPLRSRDSGFPLVVCKTRWLKEVGLFARNFSSVVHSSKYWSAL